MKTQKALIILLLFAISSGVYANNPNRIQYLLDITKVKDDKVMVELVTPNLKQEKVTFYMPKIIPGTYREADYGRFVSDVNAFDKKGRALTVNRIDDNTWEVENAKKLKRITYWVEDTYDSEIEGASNIYPMSGTNIEADKNFVVNTPGYFGYIKGTKQYKHDLHVIRPKAMYGSTGLIQNQPGLAPQKVKREVFSVKDPEKRKDVFSLSNYNHLVDSPLMYNVPDTAIINVGNTEVLISTYSPSKNVTSSYLADQVREILMAQKEFLGGKLPVDKYAFIFYLEDPQRLAPVQGALEHSYSSFYYMPDVPQENLKQTIRDVAAHEFFHIVTPLNIHSEEIQYFDFNEPQMSKHLWLYEGVTEYFSDLVQIKHGIIDEGQYLAKMRQKMQNATNIYNDTLSFAELSKETLTKHSSQYANVYEKGALIGMSLDILLRDLSSGEYGVQDLIAQLSKQYGKDKPFKDAELIDQITKMTYPEVAEFFDTYIENGAVLPYADLMNRVGISYEAKGSFSDYSLGISQASIGVIPDKQKIYVANEAALDSFGKELGLKQGDVLQKINGEVIPGFSGISQFLQATKAAMQEGENYTMTVTRKNEAGEDTEVDLTAEIFQIARDDLHIIQLNEAATPRQLKIRDAWLKAQP